MNYELNIKTMLTIKKWTAAALVMIVFLSSCQIKEIHEEYMNSFTQDYSVVNKNHWEVGDDDQSGIYFFVEFKEPNLDPFIFDRGAMQAFIFVNNGNISPLPFNDYWKEWDAYNNSYYMFTEQVTCEFRPGYVTFIIKSSDHEMVRPHYDLYEFRVRFMW